MNISEQIKKDTVKSTPLGGKVWLCAIVFGLVGQIAWAVENLTFAKFAQDIFSNSGYNDMAYLVTTLMVWFSAVIATVTTIFAGGFVDKVGKRKPFIAFGYIIWGVTIMLFALIPMKAESKNAIGLIAAALVIFDCVMTFFGSTANDAAFNTWITDVTDTTNRGKVNTIMSVFAIIAFVIVFVLQMLLYKEDASSNWLFFVVIGIIPMLSGILAIFTMKDSPKVVKNPNPNYLKETFYGFRKSVIKENKMLYVCLATSCLIGISQQTFFSYLMNFIINTLKIGDNFLLPLAVVIVGAGALTAVMGVLFDKFGRKHFYFPILALIVLGTLVIYLMKFMPESSYMAVLIVGGIFMLGAILSGGGALMSTFQDYIPKGCEGRFQGVRMCFTVMLPMILGPLITLIIGLNEVDTGAADFAPPFVIFLAAAIIAVLAFIPAYFVRKDADRLRKQKMEDKDADDSILSEIAAAGLAAEELTLGAPQMTESADENAEDNDADNSTEEVDADENPED